MDHSPLRWQSLEGRAHPKLRCARRVDRLLRQDLRHQISFTPLAKIVAPDGARRERSTVSADGANGAHRPRRGRALPRADELDGDENWTSQPAHGHQAGDRASIELHRRNLRFRKDHLIRVEGAKARVDICFTRVRVAVFVDGCFWHSCPDHCTTPKSNNSYWIPKLRTNVDRDLRVTAALEAGGWVVVRVWEHVSVSKAADRIETIVRSRQRRG